MPGASRQGLHGFTVHGRSSGLKGLYVFQYYDRLCPTCWCPDSLLYDTTYDTGKYRRAAGAFQRWKIVDSERVHLLDDDENVLLGKGDDVKEAEKKLKQTDFIL